MKRRLLSSVSALSLLFAMPVGLCSAGVSSARALPEDVVRVPGVAKWRGDEQSRRPPPASGEIEIAQYGQFEDRVTFRSAGFKAVRFDPPFEPPYTITKITFPSLTTNGVPAVFPSVRLCELDVTTGRIDLAAPIFLAAPFSGSADGENQVPLNLTVTTRGKVFFWCVEFPSSATSSFPDDFPFLRMDFVDLERGLFASSYDLVMVPSGGALPVLNYDRNIIASMSCVLPSPDLIPLEAPHNLAANLRGANLIDGRVEFSFLPAWNILADGSMARSNFLQRTELLNLNNLGQWTVVDATDAASAGSISIPNEPDLLPPTRTYVWATRSVDRTGRRSFLSSIVWMWLPPYDFIYYGSYEPNGSLDEATPMEPPTIRGIDGNCFPAGDQDFYSFYAKPGDLIDAFAGANGQPDGVNDLDLVMFLYDSKGKVVASDDNSGGLLSPRILYRVRPSSGRENAQSEKFTIQIADIKGSSFLPDAAPRVLVRSMDYTSYIYVLPPGSESARSRSSDGEAVLAPTDMEAPGSPADDENQDNPWIKAVSPNPTSRAFSVRGLVPSSGHIRITLYTVDGRRLRAREFSGLTPGGDQNFPMDAGGLPAGVYFVRYEDVSPKGWTFHIEDTAKIVLVR